MEAEKGRNRSRDGGHCLWLIVLVLVNIVAYLGALINNGLNFDAFDEDLGDNKSSKYYNEVTPAGATFGIWGVIYIWNLAWIGYTVYLLFAKKADGSPSYLNPVFLPPWHFVFFILSSVANISWFFALYRDPPILANIILFFMGFFQYLCFFFTYRALNHASPELVEQGRAKVIWQVRGLVLNGMGVYATWVSIATCINFGYLVRIWSDFQLSVQSSGVIALVILSVAIAVYISTDLIFFDLYSRYVITPYCVIVIALIGEVAKNFHGGTTIGLFLVALLIVGVACLILKVALTIYRHRTRPPYPSRLKATM